MALIGEATRYLTLAELYPLTMSDKWSKTGHEVASWWFSNREDLPNWSSFAKKVFLLVPTSASVERVFSFDGARGNHRDSALEDAREVASMAFYNGPLFNPTID